MSTPELDNPALNIDEERLSQLQKWAAIAPRSGEEDEYLRRELNSQLEAMVVKVLDPALDSELGKVAPAVYGVDLAPLCAPLRKDVAEPWPDVESLLESAPRTQDRYFVVPMKQNADL